MRTLFLLIAAAIFVPGMALADVDVTPYGFVLANASYNTRTRTDVPVIAAPDGAGEPNFLITPRQTRLGLKLKSDASYAPLAIVEIDFWGLRGSGANGGPTQAAPRLRRAFAELHFSSFDLLAGQEWIVLAPLNPTSLMHVALPGMMSSGNLWARLPQVRGTLKAASNEKSEVLLQAALTRPLGADVGMTPVEQGDVLGRGELYGWPWVQGRLGYTMKGSTSLALGAGVHYGQEDFGNDPAGDDITGSSFAVAGDVKLAVNKVTISGEAFAGKNIRTLFSTAGFAMRPDSILVDGDYVAYNEVEGVEVMGGWGELKLAASPKVDLAVSAGMESVDDEFLASGDIKSNTTLLGNVIFKPAKGIQVGVAGGFVNTERIDDDPATADTKETDDGRKNLNANVSLMFEF